MPLSLKDLIRRGDVCFFCGYHIGETGRPGCPECGFRRPAPEMIARVQRAIRIGKAGVITLAVLLGALGVFSLFIAIRAADPLDILALMFFVPLLALIVGVLTPWIHFVRHPHGLFRRYWQRTLVAVYPWGIVLALGMYLSANWLLNS